MALEFQGLTRPRGTAPATLFDPLAYVTDPGPAPSGRPPEPALSEPMLSEPALAVPTQTEVADRPLPAAAPISWWRPRQFAAVGVVALAAAGWAASVLLTASPTTGPAPVAASGASELRSPVLEFPPPSVASGAEDSARTADVAVAVPAEPTARPSKVVADNTPQAVTATPETHNTQGVKRTFNPRKAPAAAAPPPVPTQAGADQWAEAFGPNGRFWTAFGSERYGHR